MLSAAGSGTPCARADNVNQEQAMRQTGSPDTTERIGRYQTESIARLTAGLKDLFYLSRNAI